MLPSPGSIIDFENVVGVLLRAFRFLFSWQMCTSDRSLLAWNVFYCANADWRARFKYSLFKRPSERRVCLGRSRRLFQSTFLILSPHLAARRATNAPGDHLLTIHPRRTLPPSIREATNLHEYETTEKELHTHKHPTYKPHHVHYE